MRYWKAVTGVLALWLLIIVYMSNTVFPNGGDINLRTEKQLQRAMEELRKLRNQNSEVHSLASELKDIKMNVGKMKEESINTVLENRLARATKELSKLSEVNKQTESDWSHSPSIEHEVMRRKIENNAKEFWYFIRKQLQNMKDSTQDQTIVKDINSVLSRGASYQRTVLNDLGSLANTVDSLHEWREKESKDLGDLVQQRFHSLQNPKDCSKARKMLCNLGKGCGYGCQLHHITYCFMMAYANQRTLILESKGWRYAAGGWETVFLPLSETCTTRAGPAVTHWGSPESQQDAQVVELPIVDSLHPRPDYLPLAIPDDIGDRLIRLHGDPSVWWIGQFVTYLTRPQSSLRDDMEQTKKTLGFDNPIVGVHIRRTDKVGLEAAFHGVEEYMTYVEEWFNRYEQKHPGVKRKVYLATDDAGVLNEAKKGYPQYHFISDNEISKTAGLNSRYTDSSLRGVILDIHYLSLCDYLVCTFSSQVCRVAYELMQPMHGDSSQWFKSLDDVYYFGGQNGHNVEVVESHEPETAQEIDLKVNDLIGIAGNHWDGFSKGRNHRTGKTGLYPSYKVRDKIVRVKMAVYPS